MEPSNERKELLESLVGDLTPREEKLLMAARLLAVTDVKGELEALGVLKVVHCDRGCPNPMAFTGWGESARWFCMHCRSSKPLRPVVKGGVSR